jgi:hypothetical protein
MDMTQQRNRQDRSALEAELRQAGAKIRGNAVRCPFHDDRHASGSLYQDEAGVWRYRCNAQSCGVGGDVFDIRARVTGRPLKDVLRESNPAGVRRPSETIYKTLADLRSAVSRAGQIEAEYTYDNPDTGNTDLLVFRLSTAEGKAFRQAHSVPGGWVQRASAGPRPLYHRAEIRRAEEVIVVEGEKCADALNAIGITATTSPAGAGKAEYADWGPLAGKRVWVWPDNDPPGRAHGKQIAAILDRLDPAPVIRVIEPNDLDLGPKEDVCDFIAQCKIGGIDPKQAVLDVMAKAKACSLSSGVRDEIEATIDGRRRDVPWPWPILTRLARSQLPHCVTILCGSPGAAKSFTLLTSLAEWFGNGVAIAHLALEKDRTYWLQRALAIREHNVELLDPDWVKGHPDIARAAYERHQEFLDRFGKRLWDSPAQTLTLGQVADWIRQRAIEGNRIVSVDPVTATTASGQPWVADGEFVNAVRAVVQSFDMSLVLVTHPKKGGKAIGLDDLAGGAVYQRLSDTVLWVEKHSTPKRVTLARDCGRFETEINQTIHICKSRGPGHQRAVGFRINWPTLEFAEQGIIIKAKQQE